ncbi:transcriptional regulator GlxA family with amidase domain [Pararhizobium capsulatum DSM 1112]|uniref:Transcriptional regulator GlxA family with amidase domain n=1 Tax=Pararhizobium capsulatum DSM 1112 TaxID=1121113 RepID=A0ABU0BWI8_9HYPH|nr:GlxA family transcriptional regulator [Pararhizobium capsulatum]MDQ0322619.1 transcriptional regulator GlxA family with amidase domain [Pararhizobium capsulatum DSM 1112]
MVTEARTKGAVAAASSPKSLRVGFVLSKNFTLSAFALFVDTLRLASDFEDRSRRVHCDWDVLNGSRNFVMSSCGVQVAPTAPFTNPTNYDYIAVVGGLLSVEEPLDSVSLDYLRKADAAGVGLIGLCTGSFVLAQAGLLGDHCACVSWLHHREFRARFPGQPATSAQIFHFDGRRATCAGGSAVADLAATIVRHHIGEQAERNALEILQISHRRDGTDIQARSPLGLEASDRRVHLALMLMEQHVEDLLPIESIASLVSLSRRQMERLFRDSMQMSPSEAYTKIRMDAAMRMVVAQPTRPLIDIALAVGFEGMSHFTKRFRQSFGQTPSQARRQSGRKK